jgi:hypothetical protein
MARGPPLVPSARLCHVFRGLAPGHVSPLYKLLRSARFMLLRERILYLCQSAFTCETYLCAELYARKNVAIRKT